MSFVRSFSLRLALTYLILFLTSLTLLLATYYTFSIFLPERALKAEIEREALQLEEIYLARGEAGLLAELGARSGHRTGRGTFHVFIGADGKTRSANVPSWPQAAGPRWLAIDADLYVDGSEYDRLALMIDMPLAKGARLLVGRDAENIEDIKDHLEQAVIWFFASAIVIGLAGGLMISRAIGQRIERISGAAIHVMNGDLGRRVPVDGSNDDFDRLSQNLNSMLERIEELFSSVRRVSDNVAHELRTPLARLSADVQQLEEQFPDAVPSVVGKIGGEVKRLQRTFDSVLRISRIETGRHQLAIVPLDPAAIVQDVCELYLPAIDEAGGTLVIPEAAHHQIHADRDLLFQALANLLDNALKYGGPAPQLTVAVHETEQGVSFEVSNIGGHLPSETARKASERFFRGENAAGKPGEGLGLSMVKAIAEAHGGTFRLVTNEEAVTASISISHAGTSRPTLAFS